MLPHTVPAECVFRDAAGLYRQFFQPMGGQEAFESHKESINTQHYYDTIIIC